MGRFSPGGGCVGIDDWQTAGVIPARTESDFGSLLEFCTTKCPETASLLAAEFDEALGSFDDASIDLLHVTAKALENRASPLDLTPWVRKLRPGGVILLSGSGHQFGDVASKVWRQVSEDLPSATFVLTDPIGVVQVPSDERSPIVDVLSSDRQPAAALFRVLGERLELRYLFGSEPTTAQGVRSYIDRLLEDHVREVQRSESIHKLELEKTEALLASSMARLSEQSSKIEALERENNLLLARLAHYSSEHDRKLAEVRRVLERELEQLTRRYKVDIATLQTHLEDRRAEVQALRSTRSWRITRPFRVAMRAWLRVKAFGRRP